MVSVIVPTYNRKDLLIKCLNALFNQSVSKSNYEIVVVDDGSADGTEDMVKNLAGSAPVPLRYFKHEKNKGPAAARNLGIKNAEGELILFMGDDTIATPNLLEEHLKWHKENPETGVAILGYTTWAKDMNITPFMEYLETGPQFGYPDITDSNNVLYGYFYTTNISLKKDFLCAHGYFDEEFKMAMWEDIELGYRLSKHGLRLIYDKDAIVYHHHPTNIHKFLKRQYNVGRYAVLFLSKHQELISILLPQLLNPLLLLTEDQMTELIKYMNDVEGYLVSKNLSYVYNEKIKKSLFFLYNLLLMASQARGFLDELNSKELVQDKNLDLFTKIEQNIEGLTILPITPPHTIHFLIREYNNQIGQKINEATKQKDEEIRQLRASLERVRNTIAYKIDSKIIKPLRQLLE